MCIVCALCTVTFYVRKYGWMVTRKRAFCRFWMQFPCWCCTHTHTPHIHSVWLNCLFEFMMHQFLFGLALSLFLSLAHFCANGGKNHNIFWLEWQQRHCGSSSTHTQSKHIPHSERKRQSKSVQRMHSNCVVNIEDELSGFIGKVPKNTKYMKKKGKKAIYFLFVYRPCTNQTTTTLHVRFLHRWLGNRKENQKNRVLHIWCMFDLCMRTRRGWRVVRCMRYMLLHSYGSVTLSTCICSRFRSAHTQYHHHRS